LHIAVELSTKLGIGKWRTVRCLKRSIESSEEVKRDLSRSPETCLRDLYRHLRARRENSARPSRNLRVNLRECLLRIARLCEDILESCKRGLRRTVKSREGGNVG
jgi:hypothetical protein